MLQRPAGRIRGGPCLRKRLVKLSLARCRGPLPWPVAPTSYFVARAKAREKARGLWLAGAYSAINAGAASEVWLCAAQVGPLASMFWCHSTVQVDEHSVSPASSPLPKKKHLNDAVSTPYVSHLCFLSSFSPRLTDSISSASTGAWLSRNAYWTASQSPPPTMGPSVERPTLKDAGSCQGPEGSLRIRLLVMPLVVAAVAAVTALAGGGRRASKGGGGGAWLEPSIAHSSPWLPQAALC